MSEAIKVDVWSDIACPWCYIGKRRLEGGIAEYAASAGEGAALPIEIEYHSFELSPDTPVDFEGSEVDFLAGHKGLAPAQVEGMLERVTSIAESVGLHYDYDALQHTNTVKAHQLIHYAKAHGVQLEAKERLLKAYFEEGRHVGRDEDLADLAAEIGLDRADALRSLQSNEFLAEVRADQAQAVEFGIQGVPFFVFDSKYGVSGAQEESAFAQVFAQLAEERRDTGLVDVAAGAADAGVSR
ncbi:DsbA family oxidoreductase [Subtercola sp. PAMC28395]|uniref:DsbA family oxidoreductase n=1 Tax=Subtercola sp. PAMC28395 TaxID=2846775 RepID=UPI001C0D1CB5|nr:DsbA family oxidoreductase [Subtercola sp. PAMC28395]QWT23471.1 DsbA family oxidoreductase [Subtercola sp. PAMC28395]